MSATEYNELSSKTLLELRDLPFWQFARFVEACDRPRRLIILQSLAA